MNKKNEEVIEKKSVAQNNKTLIVFTSFLIIFILPIIILLWILGIMGKMPLPLCIVCSIFILPILFKLIFMIFKKSSENEVKKEKSKNQKRLVIVVLCVLLIYLIIGFITGILRLTNSKAIHGLSFAFIIILWVGYYIIKNILKLNNNERIEERMQKFKFILIIVSFIIFLSSYLIYFLYDNHMKTIERENLIKRIKQYYNNEYIFNVDYQEIEKLDTYELKRKVSYLENLEKLKDEYNEKYADELDEIFNKQINVNLYQSEDKNFVYIPFNTDTGANQTKAKVEFVTINKFANKIDAIYYSVEMNLTVYNKYNTKDVSKGVVKKYYKVTKISDLENININNYRDDAISTEISNAIDGTTIMTNGPTGKNCHKYHFINLEKQID